MKSFGVAAFAALTFLSLQTASPAQKGTPAEVSETKDRLNPEAMEALVERPMWLLRNKGLGEAQKAFADLIAAAVKAHGKGSVEEADLLTAFGVQIFLEGIDRNDEALQRAALPFIEQSIPAYKAALGARHPEVAVALNSYATLAQNLGDPKLRPTIISTLEEALAIRTESLGPENSETRATVEYLKRARDPQSNAMADALSAADNILSVSGSATESLSATANLDDGETLSLDDDGGFWKPTTSYTPLTYEFVRDLKKLEPSVEPAKRAVAAKYALSIEALTEGMSFLRAMEKSGYDRKRRDELRTRALAWLKLSNRAPVSTAFTAGAIGQLSDKCTAGDIDLLLRGSRDRDSDVWLIAATCTSSGVLAAAIDRSDKARPALLYLAMNWTRGEAATELAAIDTLLRPELLATVDPEDRDQVEAEAARFKLSKLLALGLLDEAVTFGDGLRPTVRSLVFKAKNGQLGATIGGFASTSSAYVQKSVASDYAAALALVGRAADSRAVLESVAPRAKLKKLRTCLETLTDPCPVGGQSEVSRDALAVDQLLDDPSADPYVLIEAPSMDTPSAAMSEVLCRLSTQPAEQSECTSARTTLARIRAGERAGDEDDIAFWAAIARAGGPRFDAALAKYSARLATLDTVRPANESFQKRATVEPAPVPFRELPVPPGARASPSINAILPKGFDLVRAERAGNRAIAVSLSTRYDPNGEVSGGGYWIHLSNDGGKSWSSPQYTGLAEHFPYIVPAESRLPMLVDDSLRLEVQESLIDTASITYPPVGLHIRRKRSGIYLDIPLADLAKDSDGDGLTDIAAHHLLLDEKHSRATPFVAGQDRGALRLTPTP